MKRNFCFFFILFYAQLAFAQTVIENYSRQQGALRYGPGERDVMAYGDRGFTLVLPDNRHAVAGTVIDLEDTRLSGRDSASIQGFRDEALNRGFAFLSIATGKPVDWYFSDSSMIYVDAVINDTFTKYHLPFKNAFFLGIMTSGHRALR